jgi:hypothetical protein
MLAATLKTLDLSLESLLYFPVNQYFRHLVRPIQPMLFDRNDELSQKPAESMTFSEFVVDAFQHMKTSWSLDRATAVQLTANSLNARGFDNDMLNAYDNI